ncbi:RNA-binding protein NOB1 [Blastocystis sp. ATCC 50177/Nand II]|uniref:RNA-binding protein NOB1 n=1 Tax=Blastocystis sp. subtype 1 (strain ATCC 50177 / NandII) TaxID=478820 RepID=A0A196SPG1_BLAHN|nr:RNA-binding protein NOB1 [Blastocystis sp. ATCC 50177/Nand II]
MQNNKYKALVLDSGVFIHGASVANSAETFYSIEEVMREVRDKQARGLLQRFPFEIVIRQPSPEAIQAIEKFAKATGEFPRLAQTDLLVMALTYDLQKEIGGLKDINVVPLLDRKRIMDVNDKRIVGVNVSAEPCRLFGTPEGCHYGNECIFRHPGDFERDEVRERIPTPKVEASEAAASSVSSPLSAGPSAPPKRWNVVKTVPNLFSGDDRFPTLGALPRQEKTAEEEEVKALFSLPAKPAETATEEIAEEKAEADEKAAEVKEEEENEEESEEHSDDSSEEEHSDNDSEEEHATPQPSGSRIHTSSTLVSHDTEADGGEWIDSASLSSFYSNQQTASAEEPEEDLSHCVACCTGDYSVQNVLLQMNFRVLSYDNKRITQLRVYTRRCRDCFSVCHDDTKLFCPDCGHPSLARVPVFVMKGGIVRIATAFQSKSLRGTKYSIGKNADLLLCEDQLKQGKWKQRLQKMKKASREGCLFGDVGAESLGLENSKGRSQQDLMDQIVIGFGRKNPNAMRGREKRGKKKAKKASRY